MKEMIRNPMPELPKYIKIKEKEPLEERSIMQKMRAASPVMKSEMDLVFEETLQSSKNSS